MYEYGLCDDKESNPTEHSILCRIISPYSQEMTQPTDTHQCINLAISFCTTTNQFTLSTNDPVFFCSDYSLPPGNVIIPFESIETNANGMDNSIETLSSQQQQPLPLPSIEVNQEYDKEDITQHSNEDSSLHSSPTQFQPSSQSQHQNIIQDEEQVSDSEFMTESVSISSTLSKTLRQQSLHQVDWPEAVSGDVNVKDGKDPLYGHEHQSNIDDAKVYGDKFSRNSIPKTPSQLNDHSRTLTEKSISFKCPFETWGSTFVYETNLKNHYFNCHTNQLFKCPLKNCPNVYTKKAKMRRPITHESQQCVKSAFESLSALPIRAHTSYGRSYMYKCTRAHCYETFDRISQLSEHLQTHIVRS